MTSKPAALCIFGPTGSGKTSLAIALAQQFNGCIINADSRQVYQHISTLAACPSAAEYAAAPHKCFEFLDPNHTYSAGQYVTDAGQAAAAATAAGQLPIFCGGTGFYLQCLMAGLSPIPDVPAELVAAYQAQWQADPAGTFAELEAVDPAWAAAIAPQDMQRTVRGLSVYAHTGRLFSDWQNELRTGGLPYRFICLGLTHPRDILHARLATRVEDMLAAGLLTEVQALRAAGYSLDAPGLSSIAARHFYAYLDNDISLDEAKERFLIGHRQYAKRQEAWLRHHYPADVVFSSPTVEAVVGWVEKVFHEG